jgi:hypothetical protein
VGGGDVRGTKLRSSFVSPANERPGIVVRVRAREKEIDRRWCGQMRVVGREGVEQDKHMSHNRTGDPPFLEALMKNI